MGYNELFEPTMPKIVDHAERRLTISRAVVATIEKHGLAGTTIRSIVREGGFSAGVLAHYFKNKEEMVSFAFEVIAENAFERLTERLPSIDTLNAKLQFILEEMLPSPCKTKSGVTVSISFWSAALNDPTLRIQFKKQYQIWKRFFVNALEQGIHMQELKAGCDVSMEADLLIAQADGLMLSMTLDPGRVPISQVNVLIQRIISSLTSREPLG